MEHLREPAPTMPATTDRGLLQGTLDVLVLKTLSWGPRHGYAVARWIKDTSDAAIQVEDRALYIALHRLEERGLVERKGSRSDRRVKTVALTAEGEKRKHELEEKMYEPPPVMGEIDQGSLNHLRDVLAALANGAEK